MVLPHVDTHTVEIDATADAVWRELVRTVDGAFSRPAAARYARVIGAEPATRSPAPTIATGTTLPGFRVTHAAPGGSLVLSGRHRCSTYELTFELDEVAPGRTRLSARTDADFPGRLGAAYRLAVIASGGHRLVTRRLLAGIGRRAQRASESRQLA